MSRLLLPALVVGLTVSPITWAQLPYLPPVPKQPTKAEANEVSKLVKQLADADFTKRDQASASLEKLGTAALPLLRDAVRKSDDTEVRRRLEEIIPRLEQAAALQPTLVSVSFRDLLVRKAVAELSRVGGYKLELSQNGARQTGTDDPEKRLVSLELKNVPFWQALDRLCEVSGLTFQEGWYGHDQETLRLEFGESHASPMYVNGAFRITIRGFDYQRSLYFNQGF